MSARVAVLGLALVACRGKPAIDVVRRGEDVVFRFGHCADGDAARIMDLEVAEPGASVPRCALVLTHDPRMTIAGEWRYGDVPAAYKKKRCDPLTPGRYRMTTTHALLDFEVAEGGAVRALSSRCQ